MINILRGFMKPKHSKKMTDHEKVMYVKRGGDLGRFTPDEVREMQDRALNIKDIKLYDVLEQYWITIRWHCR